MSDQDYKYQYHTYPVYSSELSAESAFKRFTPFPTPQDVYDFCLMGMPKVFPMTREPIPLSVAEKFLTSAVTHLEMSLGCNLSEVVHYHSEDSVADMFTSNFTGVNLQRWPATQIIQFQVKYAHTNTTTPYATFSLPSAWIYLMRNKVNILAGIGTVTPIYDNAGLVTASGLFGYGPGFNSRDYQPGTIEIVYKAGFEHDRMPANVADLIITVASRFMLEEIAPMLFPQNTVSVNIDSVGQSVGLNVAQMLQTKIQQLKEKQAELTKGFTSQFGQSVKFTRFGA